jgi:hypothetical protein
MNHTGFKIALAATILLCFRLQFPAYAATDTGQVAMVGIGLLFSFGIMADHYIWEREQRRKGGAR